MKHLWRVAVLLLWVELASPTGCTKADAKTPAAPSALDSFTIQVSGDTAKGFYHWTAGRNATEYLVTITASSGVWTGLPVNLSIRGLVGSFIATNATVDSTDFTVCIKSWSSQTLTASSATCSVPKRWRRPPSPPPLIVWDSLTVASWQQTGSICPTGHQRWAGCDTTVIGIRTVLISTTGRVCAIANPIPPTVNLGRVWCSIGWQL